MADIELVIKIPEEDYINIKNAINSLIENGVERASMSSVCLAIIDGTPLPKGHGRLVDADVFEKRLMSAREYYIGEKANNFDLRFATGLKSACERLVDSPTIIEADVKGKEE